MEQQALILFTRLPIPGKTKTRLMPALTPAACAELQWALLADLAPVLRESAGDLFVFYTPDDSPAELARLRGLMPAAACRAQSGGNLGARMNQAFTQIFEAGYDGCVLMGSDIPLVDASDIAEAWRELRDHDVVLAPSEDGGYWLVGLKLPFAALFAGQVYGTDSVMEQARHRCAAAGKRLGYGRRRRDLDVIEDLYFFQRTVTRDPSPHFYDFMAEWILYCDETKDFGEE